MKSFRQRPPVRMQAALLCIIPALAALTPSGGRAQSHTWLPEAHWSVRALHELAALRVLPARVALLSVPAQRSELASWLDSAAARAERLGNPAVRERVQSYRALLAHELAGNKPFQAAAAAGASHSGGALRAGTMQQAGSEYVYPGPVPQRSRQAALLRGEAYSGRAGPIGLAVRAGLSNDSATMEAAYAALRLRGVSLWAGRRPFGFGEGVVLHRPVALDGGGIALREGVRLPLIGRVVPDLVVARMQRSGSVEHPWFTAARITVAPTSSLVINLNRAAIFGGAGNEAVTLRRVLLMMTGVSDVAGKDSDFENQVASFAVSWQTAIGAQPLRLYGELGTDDYGYAFYYVPGLVGGIELAGLKPGLSLGLEVTYLAERCCTYPPWYQHGALADGWSDRGTLLGHPLGGAGSEIALPVRLHEPRLRWLAGGRLFLRERARENLLAPALEGRSVGGTLDVLVPWRRLQLQVRGGAEFGENDYRATNLSVLAHVFLP